MSTFIKNLFNYFIIFIILLVLAYANWIWPLYQWFGDTPVMRFVWLGLFFVILDFLFEVITKSFDQIRFMMEAMSFSREIRKMSAGFHVISKFVLSNKLKADHIVVGSSGVWLISIRNELGKMTFNGDEILQNQDILKGLISASLEKAYTLTGYLKEKLGRDIRVAPVIAFSSTRADLKDMPKQVRGVFISSSKDTVPLIENTDFQLIDKNTIEEVYNILKK